jgi:hypothetical protein
VFSIALLAFVAHDKPYRSEDGEEERLCMEDKMMILSQVCAYISKQVVLVVKWS